MATPRDIEPAAAAEFVEAVAEMRRLRKKQLDLHVKVYTPPADPLAGRRDYLRRQLRKNGKALRAAEAAVDEMIRKLG